MSLQVRRAVSAAVAWSIIAEVVRHDGAASDLRVGYHLVAFVGRNGVLLSVEWDGESWDSVYAEDVEVRRGATGGLEC